jgi:hypothetical protein
MHQDWKTQHIVVTGAASGLGRAVCMVKTVHPNYARINVTRHFVSDRDIRGPDSGRQTEY